MKRQYTTLVLLAGSLALSACANIFSTPLYDRLTDSDAALAVTAMQTALEKAQDGEMRAWKNEASGNAGNTTPLKTFVTEKGFFCRDYRETLMVGKDKDSRELTACRNAAGRWLWPDMASN